MMTSKHASRPILFILIGCLFVAIYPTITAPALGGKRVGNEPIKVVKPVRFADREIPAVRSPLGIPDDYKPWIARLKNGELLIVAFHAGRNPVFERAVFWRSRDGGRTWGARQERKDIHGREFALTCLSEGTLLMSCHFLGQDKFNKSGYWYSKLFRSADNGKTWSEILIGPENFPVRGSVGTDRNVIELPAPKASDKSVVLFGVSQGGTASHTYLWQSRDGGRSLPSLVRSTQRQCVLLCIGCRNRRGLRFHTAL